MLLGTFTTALFATGVITLEQHKSLFVLCLGALSFILIDLAYEFYKLANETLTSGVTEVNSSDSHSADGGGE